MTTTWQLARGATVCADGAVRFSVWAPRVQRMTVQIMSPLHTAAMARNAEGLHIATVAGVSPGSRYSYVLDGERVRPDPASRFQPEGVHGPSVVVDPHAFHWTDQTWTGLVLKDLILYELHPGTFTTGGTFIAILDYLDYLRNDVGITAVELMPVAEFPGARNWGYDGVHPYAPHSAYGGPHGLKTLINACHEKGLAVVLDVVYNHLGPEGNYLGEYGPYFTDRYQTPWGQAVNFDGPDSQEVRRYFIDNALYWVSEYHIDALRLDAIHGIFDAGTPHILQELGMAVHAYAGAAGRTILVIAESDLNDNHVITDIHQGGWGLDAQWSDDFHHAVHTLVTNERDGYYHDFSGLADVITSLTDGFVYQGQESAFRKRPHGTPSRHLPGERFVVCNQNHDQIGNRALGERLSTLAPFPALKLIAGLTLYAPNIPLLFMGEEYGELAPFLYFTSHTDTALAEAVRKGRQQEFAEFAWGQEVPDPQDLQTFHRSRLRHHLRAQEPHSALLRFYHDLIALRKRSPALHNCDKTCLEVTTAPEQPVLLIHRWQPQHEAVFILASCAAQPIRCTPAIPAGHWQKQLDSTMTQYGGMSDKGLPPELPAGQAINLAPFTFAIYHRALSSL